MKLHTYTLAFEDDEPNKAKNFWRRVLVQLIKVSSISKNVIVLLHHVQKCSILCIIYYFITNIIYRVIINNSFNKQQIFKNASIIYNK